MTGSDAPARPLRERLPQWVVPVLLGLLCLLVYNANLRTIGAGDTLPARYQPLILLHDGALDLEKHARLVAHGHPLPASNGQKQPVPAADEAPAFSPHAYWMTRSDENKLISLYPVVTPLLVTPLYLPAYVWLNERGWTQPQIDRAAEITEKLAASLLAALASVLMFLLLRREGIRWALPLALAFAFGTDTWTISSQALWQHGTGELLVVLALMLTLGRGSPARLAALGFVCVLIAANRPPDALIAAAFLLYAVWRRRRDTGWLIAGGSLPLAALLYYNLQVTGNLLGGYEQGRGGKTTFFDVDLLGPAGLLVSPGRGLLIFTPFLVFVVVGLALRLRDPKTRGLTIALGVAMVVQFLVYSQADWRAGVSWGPRWLADVLPILVWMLAPAPAALRPVARRALIATILFSVGVQAVGAFWYTKTSDERIFRGDPESTREAWKPRNTPFVVELGHGRARGELRCGARGFFERIGSTVLRDDGAAAPLESGAPIQGWAQTCGRTPAQVLVLVNGAIVGATSQFTPRPDVDRALGIDAPTGWAVTADTRGVRPGRHVIQLAVRVHPRSDIRILREETVTVAAPATAATDLRGMAARATQRVQDDQSDDGYWLTTFTSGPRYEAPQDELNTYLTASMVDLLGPVAAGRRLDETLTRARTHLAAQIEPSGLVRYHGLPDAPTIGTLGCAITPDADDTALTWRIAGKGAADPRSQRMLATLARFRDARGLYKTWLAAQDDFECIDPGRNPNPADLVNQMHIYLMLRRLDPPAARDLCVAMRRVAGDDDALVYYARAPLIFYLRSAELGQRGCRLPVPTAQLARRAVPGQEPWTELVQRLVRSLGPAPDADARQAVRGLLTRLGRDDFALLRRTPPLLYHNDLSATVNRFYWSEDVGYALWLRLYEAASLTPP